MAFILFPTPLNFGNQRTNRNQVVDGNLNSYTEQTTVECHIDTDADGTGTAQAFTHIALISSGVTSYKASGSRNIADNSNHTLSRTIGSSFENSFGEDISRDFNGRRYDLFRVPQVVDPDLRAVTNAELEAQTLNFTLVGTNIKVYLLAVLKAEFELAEGAFDVTDIDSVQLGRVADQADKSQTYIPPLFDKSDVWRVRLRAELYGSRHPESKSNELVAFIRKNKHYFVAVDTEIHPELIFAGIFPNPETQIRYITGNKIGRRVGFSLRER